MTRRIAQLIVILILSAAVFIAWNWNRKSHSSYFRSSEEDLELMRSHISELQSVLGIERNDFEFRLPAGYCLFADFHAELNDEVVPEMTATYQIVPARDSDPTDGEIIVQFFHPPFDTDDTTNAEWHLVFRAENQYRDPGPTISSWWSTAGDGIGNSFSMECPFDAEKIKGGGGRSRSLGSIEEGRNYEVEVWRYHGWSEFPDDSFQFTYTLTVKMERIKETDKLGEVVKVEQ